MRNMNSRRSTRRPSAQLTFGVVAFIALLLCGFLLYQWLKWDLYWVWLVVATVVTFAFFRFDKNQAQQAGATRVPEVILLTLMAIGGVVGGAAGMLMRPRHKTQKPLFWIVLWLAAAMHAYLLYQRFLV